VKTAPATYVTHAGALRKQALRARLTKRFASVGGIDISVLWPQALPAPSAFPVGGRMKQRRRLTTSGTRFCAMTRIKLRFVQAFTVRQFSRPYVRAPHARLPQIAQTTNHIHGSLSGNFFSKTILSAFGVQLEG
jgi:hypothetical protein